MWGLDEAVTNGVFATLCAAVSGGFVLAGVLITVNRQKTPKVVELQPDDLVVENARLAAALATVTIERDVWKQIALDKHPTHE